MFHSQYLAFLRKQVNSLCSDASLSHFQQQQRPRSIKSSGKDFDTDYSENNGGSMINGFLNSKL